MGEKRGVYRVLLGKPEGRRPLGRPGRRWVDNIRTDLQEVGCGYMDWTGLAQDRDSWQTLVSAVMNLRVRWNAGNFLTSCKPVSFSRRTLHHGVSKLARCYCLANKTVVFDYFILFYMVWSLTWKSWCSNRRIQEMRGKNFHVCTDVSVGLFTEQLFFPHEARISFTSLRRDLCQIWSKIGEVMWKLRVESSFTPETYSVSPKQFSQDACFFKINYFFGTQFHVLRSTISLASNFTFYAQIFLWRPVSRKIETLFWMLILRHGRTWSS